MKKKDVDEIELGTNPFINDLSIPVRRVSKKEFSESGEQKFYVFDLELTESCKFYITPEIRKSLRGISGTGCQILLWIMQKVENGKDYIWMSKDKCMEELDINSVNTYKAAIKSLCGNSFLAPIYMMPDVYWINPKIYFNGNRAKRFPENTNEYVSKNKTI